MSTPVIPAPTAFKVVSLQHRAVLTVRVDDRTVALDYDDSGSTTFYTTLRFSVFPDQPLITAVSTAVTEAFKTCAPVSAVAVSAELGCGGETEVPQVTGTSADVAAVLTAIPHFYAEERDREMRRALRSIYRWLLRVDVSALVKAGA